MKTFTIYNLRLAILTALLLAAGSLHASLTAIVTPGYQFPIDGSVAPTYVLLNELGMPTITIVGTIGGSNTLAPGSITTISFAASVVDGTTIGFNGNSPAGLQVLAAGITSGLGLMPTNTSQLELYLDPTYFITATNSIGNTNIASTTPYQWLTFKANSLSDTNVSLTAGIQLSKLQAPTNPAPYVLGYTNTGPPVPIFLAPDLSILWETNVFPTVTNIGLTLTSAGVNGRFVSGLFALSAGKIADTPHGLGATPSVVSWVLQCQTADQGYSVGDEVDVKCFTLNSSPNVPIFSAGGNSTNVFCSLGQLSPLTVQNKQTGALSGITSSRWEAKCYARP